MRSATKLCSSQAAGRYLSSRSSLSWCGGSRFHRWRHELGCPLQSQGLARNGRYKTRAWVDNRRVQTRLKSSTAEYHRQALLEYFEDFLHPPSENHRKNPTMSRSQDRISSYRRHFEDSSSSSYQVRVSSPSPTRRDSRHASAGYSCRSGAGSMRVESAGRRNVSAARRTRIGGKG